MNLFRAVVVNKKWMTISCNIFLKSSSVLIIAGAVSLSVCLLFCGCLRDFNILNAFLVGIIAGFGAPTK